MITSQVVAEVRRVLRGHSDRALVHAVDGEGLEYKIEVPLDQVRALSDQQGHVLTITYAIHTLPGLAPPAADLEEAASSAGAPTPAGAPVPASGATSAGEAMGTPDPAAVDAEFMALMNRRSGSSTSSTSSNSTTSSTSTPPSSSSTSSTGAPSTPAGAPFGAPASPLTGASSAGALASRSAGPSRPVTTTAPGAEADPLADILGDLR
ncbi:MAG: hypothetical protein R3B09_35725 [Nannocystaceae bacterium]